jgi:hypothetical protein
MAWAETIRCRYALITCVVVLLAGLSGTVADAGPGHIEYGPAQKLAELANQRIRESSGLACSRKAADVFWTHNDAGNAPRIFAFNSKGEDLGAFRVPGAKARDWEDMASAVLEGTPCLLLADVGDNRERRTGYTLYLVAEPDIGVSPSRASGTVRVLQTVHFTYEDGPRDCESVALDPTTRTVLLVSKELAPTCTVFALAWPGASTDVGSPAVAHAVATIDVPVATAMDISPDGRRVMIGTYQDAFEFLRGKDEAWREALSRKGRAVKMPWRLQGESICYGLDGETVYLTSEKLPTPFFEVSRARPVED